LATIIERLLTTPGNFSVIFLFFCYLLSKFSYSSAKKSKYNTKYFDSMYMAFSTAIFSSSARRRDGMNISLMTSYISAHGLSDEEAIAVNKAYTRILHQNQCESIFNQAEFVNCYLMMLLLKSNLGHIGALPLVLQCVSLH